MDRPTGDARDHRSPLYRSLRAAAPVYLEDVNDRGVVVLVTSHHDHGHPHRSHPSRYFYPWGVVGWIRLAEDEEGGREEVAGDR